MSAASKKNTETPATGSSKNKRIFIIVGILAIVSIAWAIVSSNNSSKIRDILTAQVRKGNLTVTVNEFGELIAKDQATISSINDKVIQYLAPEGSWAEQGDTLVIFESEKYKIYTEDAHSAVKVAEAELQRALNEVEAQKSKEEAAKKEYETLPQLAEKGYIVESEVEQARLSYLEMRSKTKSLASVVKAREADVERAKSNLKNQKRKLSETAILAPRDGIVVYATVGTGENAHKIQEGMVPFEGMDLMYLPDIGSMQVKSELNEVDLGKVRIDQPVEIKLDAFPGAIFKGHVESIGTLARRKFNPATGKPTGTKVFDLIIQVDEKDKRLKPGLSANVDIIVSKLENVLYVPIESVFTTDKERTYVYLKRDDAAEKRLVESGKSNDLYVEVKNGLEENEIVLLDEPR